MKVDFQKCRGSYPNLSAGFASEDRRREKQLTACSFDASHVKHIEHNVFHNFLISVQAPGP